MCSENDWPPFPKNEEEGLAIKLGLNINNEPKKRIDYYQPEIALPLNIIKRDLTKTIAVTILALFLQGGLYFYLQKAGWGQLLATLQKINL